MSHCSRAANLFPNARETHCALRINCTAASPLGERLLLPPLQWPRILCNGSECRAVKGMALSGDEIRAFCAAEGDFVVVVVVAAPIFAALHREGIIIISARVVRRF